MSKDNKKSGKKSSVKTEKLTKAAKDSTESFERLGKEMLKLKQAAKEASEAFEAARNRYLEALVEADQSKMLLKHKGVKYSTSVTRRQNLVIDSEGLKKALGVRKFNTVAEYKVNRSKLEEAVELGKFDHDTVQKFLSVKEGDPFITITAIKEDDNEDR